MDFKLSYLCQPLPDINLRSAVAFPRPTRQPWLSRTQRWCWPSRTAGAAWPSRTFWSQWTARHSRNTRL